MPFSVPSGLDSLESAGRCSCAAQRTFARQCAAVAGHTVNHAVTVPVLTAFSGLGPYSEELLWASALPAASRAMQTQSRPIGGSPAPSHRTHSTHCRPHCHADPPRCCCEQCRRAVLRPCFADEGGTHGARVKWGRPRLQVAVRRLRRVDRGCNALAVASAQSRPWWMRCARTRLARQHDAGETTDHTATRGGEGGEAAKVDCR